MNILFQSRNVLFLHKDSELHVSVCLFFHIDEIPRNIILWIQNSILGPIFDPILPKNRSHKFKIN
jgi:hypothetical protein